MKTILRNRPTVITDAPEHRAIPIHQVELRAADDNADEVELTGYASTFEPYEMYGGPAAGGWIEQIDKKAFTKTLRESPDLMLLINHEGMPLARTKSGTLKLSVDSHGLKVSAKLDRSDPDVQRLEAKMRRGDMDEMSFAFRVKAQKWESMEEFPDDLYAKRTILEVSLHKGDVSVVNYGANPTTHAEVKGLDEAIELLCNAGAEQLELIEARSDTDKLARLKANVDKLMTKPTAPDERSEPEPKAADDKPKGMSVLEAYRRMGFGTDDGSTLRTEEAAAMANDDKNEALRAANAGHAALLAKLNGESAA